MALKYADILNQSLENSQDSSDEVSVALSGDQFDYAKIATEVAKAQAVVTPIMQKVREDISKGWKQLPNSGAKRSPKSWFFDPLTLQYSLGYKDRRFSLSFDILKKTVSQLSILGAIINTRIAQVCSFAKPYRHTRSLGFVIKHKDPDHKTTSAEVAMIKDLENFIMNCGRADPNPYSRKKRDDFEDFLAKFVRDSLTFDQGCSEVVYDHLGLPYEFYAVDGSTLRIASDDRYVGVNSSYHSRSGFVPAVPSRFAGLYEGREYGHTDISTAEGKPVSYVQVVNGQIENIYSEDELIFGVRNPRTDIYVQGYGLSEIEQGLTIVSSMLYAEMYNRNNFTNGSIPMGILNLKGDNWTDEQLEQFKRHWTAQMQGAENAKKTPVLQSEGIEWIDFTKPNRDMEFNTWLEYLLKVLCALYRIDPAELNFEMQGGVQQTPLFESAQEWKLKASRDRGLKPLLGFIAKLINKNIIDKIDDHFALEFVGLDEMSEEDKHNMLTEQLSSYMTLNEVRRQLDMPDLPEGDIPMNPTYLDVLKMKQEQEMQEQQMQQEQEMQEQQMQEEQPMEEDQQNYLPASDPEAVEEEPRFTNNYGLPTQTDIY